MQWQEVRPFSCGVVLIHGLLVPDKLKERFFNCYLDACARTPIRFGNDIGDPLLFPHVMFSDHVRGVGSRLAELLSEYGEITSTPPKRNPNTGRSIVVWTWTPSPDRITKFRAKLNKGERYSV